MFTLLAVLTGTGFALALALGVVAWHFRRELTNRELRLENLQADLQLATSQQARLEAENSALNGQLDEQKRFLAESKETLENSFRSLAAKALEGNNQQFIDLAKQILAKESGTISADLEKRDQGLRLLLDPLKDSLNRYQSFAQQIEVERQKSYSSLATELRRVVDASSSLAQTTTALKDALKKPHVRGRWGEMQLRNCIELAGMSEYSDVHFQDATTNEEGLRLIPDMTVRMPGGRLVVVDAKTPIDAFIASLETTDREVRDAEMVRHGRHVKDHVKRLATRAYGDLLEESADFTVMFLPNESFLYAALETEPDLVEFALQRKVLIATPPTLIGLLKVIRFGWNEEKLAANAKLISDAGKELHKRVCDFVEAYTNVGKALEKARTEFDTGMMRLERRVLVQARRLEKLGAKSSKSLPEGLAEATDDVEIDTELLTGADHSEVSDTETPSPG
ncbi:MAG: DNA recombination protein RmuC [Bdellovibrionales bacterium]|nr:DNA recombination protein RmuC [Bdellovibrionales bacterium]